MTLQPTTELTWEVSLDLVSIFTEISKFFYLLAASHIARVICAYIYCS